jgi:signal transduction histidine kinase
MDAKARASTSISLAKSELDHALTELDKIHSFDPSTIGLAAHALNNSITVTVATTEMLQRVLRDHPDADVPIWLEGIRHAADLMQHTVSRLVSGSAPREFPLKPEYVNLPVLMERTCQYHRRRADPAQVGIVCRPVTDIPLVWADRVALAIVADNLLSNAVQFSRPLGTIRVQIMREPGHVVCSICDEGPGLTKEQADRILRQPLPASPSEAGAATGYGLAVAKQFVERMDGELWCESDPGRGACFSFRLPALE